MKFSLIKERVMSAYDGVRGMDDVRVTPWRNGWCQGDAVGGMDDVRVTPWEDGRNWWCEDDAVGEMDDVRMTPRLHCGRAAVLSVVYWPNAGNWGFITSCYCRAWRILTPRPFAWEGPCSEHSYTTTETDMRRRTQLFRCNVYSKTNIRITYYIWKF